MSHCCEKARWALDWLKISYTANHGNFVDSTDILYDLSATAPTDKNYIQMFQNYVRKLRN